jgi:hypothetical protein
MEDQEGDRTRSVIRGRDLMPWHITFRITPAAIPCTIEVLAPVQDSRS